MGNLNQKIYTENGVNEKDNRLLNENYRLKNEITELKKLNESNKKLIEELNNKNDSSYIQISCLRYKINILKQRLNIYGESFDHI